MRAFIISLTIILAIFLLTVANSVCVGLTTDELIEKAKSIKLESNSVESFVLLWEEKQSFIRISSSHDETHKIDEALAVLKAKANEGDSSGFCEQRALLVEYLTQIHEDETVSFDSII